MQNRWSSSTEASHPPQVTQLVVELDDGSRHRGIGLFLQFPRREAITDLWAEGKMAVGHVLEEFTLRPGLGMHLQRVGSVVLEANLIFHRDASLSRGDPRSALNQPLRAEGGLTHLFLKRLSLKVSSRSISSSLSLMKT